MTIMSPKAAILQKLVVVTSHMYIPAFGSSNLPSSVVLVHEAMLVSKLCRVTDPVHCSDLSVQRIRSLALVGGRRQLKQCGWGAEWKPSHWLLSLGTFYWTRNAEREADQ